MNTNSADKATTLPVLGVCLAGPTASGKTAAALALAASCPVEIISVDSALVYRHMDIGTAKPSAAERDAVPHHLIDILDPSQAYSAARFAADAQRLAVDIRRRGRLPLLVGGTMLYFKALREGMHAMPEADASIRAQIDSQAATRGWPALHAELARVDPATAARLAPGDGQRIQRALEVWQLSGRPLSEWHQLGPQHAPDEGAWPLVALVPAQRSWLHERIAQRFDAMWSGGLVQEVQSLRQRPQLHAGLPAMRCVGYRQIWEALDGGWIPGQSAHADQLVRDAGVAATRQLAKRQLTWLRSISSAHTVDCDANASMTSTLDVLRRVAGLS